jgi:hypothetical protein
VLKTGSDHKALLRSMKHAGMGEEAQRVVRRLVETAETPEALKRTLAQVAETTPAAVVSEVAQFVLAKDKSRDPLVMAPLATLRLAIGEALLAFATSKVGQSLSAVGKLPPVQSADSHAAVARFVSDHGLKNVLDGTESASPQSAPALLAMYKDFFALDDNSILAYGEATKRMYGDDVTVPKGVLQFGKNNGFFPLEFAQATVDEALAVATQAGFDKDSTASLQHALASCIRVLGLLDQDGPRLQEMRALVDNLPPDPALRYAQHAPFVAKMPTAPMDGQDPTQIERTWRTDKVQYLTAVERVALRIQVIDGLLYQGTTVFDTSDAFTINSGNDNRIDEQHRTSTQSSSGARYNSTGFAICVMSPTGALYGSKEHRRIEHWNKGDAFYHPSFFNYEQGQYAYSGEWCVFDGKVKAINLKSGHILPPVEYMIQVLCALHHAGADISETIVSGGFTNGFAPIPALDFLQNHGVVFA